jgi:hypothetical protein
MEVDLGLEEMTGFMLRAFSTFEAFLIHSLGLAEWARVKY